MGFAGDAASIANSSGGHRNEQAGRTRAHRGQVRAARAPKPMPSRNDTWITRVLAALALIVQITTFTLFLTTDPIGFVWRATQRRSNSLEFWLLTSSDVLGGRPSERTASSPSAASLPRGVGSGRQRDLGDFAKGLDDRSALPGLSGAAHSRRHGRTSAPRMSRTSSRRASCLAAAAELRLGLASKARCEAC